MTERNINHNVNAQSTREQNKKRFIKFNVFLIGGTLLLYLLSIYIPAGPKIIKSPWVINHILPLLYFAIFSFFFGGLFLAGNDEMTDFLLEYFDNKTLDIGIVAAYTGALAVFMAMFIRTIIENILGVKIVSSPSHDVVGFVIGRIILLTVINVFNLR